MPSSKSSRPWITYVIIVLFLLALGIGWLRQNEDAAQADIKAKPALPVAIPESSVHEDADRETPVDPDSHGSDSNHNAPREVTMAEMLSLAEKARDNVVKNVDDYTARLIKHEQDRSGVLQEPSEMRIKVKTRHQAGTLGDPLKVYLGFESPESAKGREVIWIENENDGQLLVREAGMLGGMLTVKLMPDNFLAMRGQRYPITQIGITRLIEKLIERGREDIDDPNVRVVMTPNHEFEGRPLTLLQIERSKPSDREGDFSKAEIILDTEQQLVLSFRSFGWPTQEAPNPPLIESYEYRDLQLNVGLTDTDFDPANPDYTFAE